MSLVEPAYRRRSFDTGLRLRSASTQDEREGSRRRKALERSGLPLARRRPRICAAAAGDRTPRSAGPWSRLAGRSATGSRRPARRAPSDPAPLPRRDGGAQPRYRPGARLADGPAGPLRRRASLAGRAGAGDDRDVRRRLGAGDPRRRPVGPSRAGRPGAGDRSLELSLSHRRQHDRPGAARRQRRDPQALRPRPRRRASASPRRFGPPGFPAGSSPICSSIMRRRRGCSARASSTMPPSPVRSKEGRRSSGRRRGPSPP